MNNKILEAKFCKFITGFLSDLHQKFIGEQSIVLQTLIFGGFSGQLGRDAPPVSLIFDFVLDKFGQDKNQ